MDNFFSCYACCCGVGKLVKPAKTITKKPPKEKTEAQIDHFNPKIIDKTRALKLMPLTMMRGRQACVLVAFGTRMAIVPCNIRLWDTQGGVWSTTTWRCTCQDFGDRGRSGFVDCLCLLPYDRPAHIKFNPSLPLKSGFSERAHVAWRCSRGEPCTPVTAPR